MLDLERERALVAKVKAGGRAARQSAFEEIYEALRRPIFALCRNLTGSATDAEDALQEVFLAVYRALPRFRGESRLSTWVHRIAIRTTLRATARQHKRAALPLEVEPAARASVDPVVAAELSEQLGRALAALPFEQRAVLSLFSVEGLAQSEIAEILGVPVGTVWSRLHLARKRLLAALQSHLASRPGSTTRRPGQGVASEREPDAP